MVLYIIESDAMAWLVIANVVAIVSLAASCPPSHTQLEFPTVYTSSPKRFQGTNCSAINYNKSCCLPDAKCYAIDGECSCSPHCYTDRRLKCCEDIHCPSRKLSVIIIILYAILHVQ